MSGYIFHGQWSAAIRYLIPLTAFIAGILTAETIHRRFTGKPSFHWRQFIILIEILILFIVGAIPQSFNIPANVLVSFVCAMQVQTFRKIGSHSYSSTMCIGNLRNGTDALCSFIHNRRKSELKKACIYFGIISVFFLGAGAGYTFTEIFGLVSIRFSCLPLAFAFIVMLFSEATVFTEQKILRKVKNTINNL